MTRLFLNPAGHVQMVMNLKAATDAIQAELDTLDEAAATLRSQWSGSAQTAYEQAHREWSDVMSSLHTDLRLVAVNGRTAGELLMEADRTAVGIWV